jgi:hypothetical protein
MSSMQLDDGSSLKLRNNGAIKQSGLDEANEIVTGATLHDKPDGASRATPEDAMNISRRNMLIDAITQNLESDSVSDWAAKEVARVAAKAAEQRPPFLCDFGCGFGGAHAEVDRHEGACALRPVAAEAPAPAKVESAPSFVPRVREGKRDRE